MDVWFMIDLEPVCLFVYKVKYYQKSENIRLYSFSLIYVDY